MPAVSRASRSTVRNAVEGNFLDTLKREDLPSSLRCQSTPPPASSADSQPGSFNDDDEGPYNQDGALLTSAEREVLEALLPQKMERKRRSPGLKLTAVERGVNPSDETQMRNLGRERNKQSAQISRKRKELYQKALEGRVMRFGKMCIEATARAAAADATNAQNTALQARCTALEERLATAVELLQQVENAAVCDSTVEGVLTSQMPHFHASVTALCAGAGALCSARPSPEVGAGSHRTAARTATLSDASQLGGNVNARARTLPASVLPPELEECAQRLGFTVGPCPEVVAVEVGGETTQGEASNAPSLETSSGAGGAVMETRMEGAAVSAGAEMWDVGACKRGRGLRGIEVEVGDDEGRGNDEDATIGRERHTGAGANFEQAAMSKRAAGAGGSGVGGCVGFSVRGAGQGEVSVEAAAAAVGMGLGGLSGKEGDGAGVRATVHPPSSLLLRKNGDSVALADASMSAFRPPSLQLLTEPFHAGSVNVLSPARFGTSASLSLPTQPSCACAQTPPHPSSSLGTSAPHPHTHLAAYAQNQSPTLPVGWDASLGVHGVPSGGIPGTPPVVASSCTDVGKGGVDQDQHEELSTRRGSAEVVVGAGGVSSMFECGYGFGGTGAEEYAEAGMECGEDLYGCGREGDGEGSVTGVEIVSAVDHPQGLPLLSGGRGDGEEEVGGSFNDGGARAHGSFTSRGGRGSFGTGGFSSLRGWAAGAAVSGPMCSPVGGIAAALLDDSLAEGSPAVEGGVSRGMEGGVDGYDNCPHTAARGGGAAVSGGEGGDEEEAEGEGSAAETSPATTLMCSDCGSGVCMCAHLHSSLSSREGRSPPHEAGEVEADVDMVTEGVFEGGVAGGPGEASRKPHSNTGRATCTTRRRVGSFSLGAPAIEARLFEQQHHAQGLQSSPPPPSHLQQRLQQVELDDVEHPHPHQVSHPHHRPESPFLCGLLPQAAVSPHASPGYPATFHCVSPGVPLATAAALVGAEGVGPTGSSPHVPPHAASPAPLPLSTVRCSDATPMPNCDANAVDHTVVGGATATVTSLTHDPTALAHGLSSQSALSAVTSVACSSRSPSASCARTPASACVKGGSLYSTSCGGSSGVSCASGYFDVDGGSGGGACGGWVGIMGESISPPRAVSVGLANCVVGGERFVPKGVTVGEAAAMTVAGGGRSGASSGTEGTSRSSSSCAHVHTARRGEGAKGTASSCKPPRSGGRVGDSGGRRGGGRRSGGGSSDTSATPPPPVSSCGPREGRPRRSRRVLPTGSVAAARPHSTASGPSTVGADSGKGTSVGGRPLFAFFLFAAMTLCTSHAGWTSDLLGGLTSSVPILDSVFEIRAEEGQGVKATSSPSSSSSPLSAVAGPCSSCPPPSPSPFARTLMSIKLPSFPRGVVEAVKNEAGESGPRGDGTSAAAGGAHGGHRFGPVGGLGGVGVVGMGGGAFGRGRAPASARRGGRARVSDDDVEVELAEDGMGGLWEVRSGGTAAGPSEVARPSPVAATGGVPLSTDVPHNVTASLTAGRVVVMPMASKMSNTSSPTFTAGGATAATTKRLPHTHTRSSSHGRGKGRAVGSGVGGGVGIAQG